MMTLKKAAHFFDRNRFTDTYGSAYFLGQVLPFSDSVASGPAAKRRILEVDPSATIPARRTVTELASGNVYIVAKKASDFFGAEEIRAKYPILPVDTQFSIRTIAQVLASSGGVTDAYMSPSYIRRQVLEDQSDYLGGYEFFFSTYHSITQGQILTGASRYYRVRENSRIDDTGFAACEAVEIASPIQSYTFQGKGTTYNVANDNFTPPAAVSSVSCFVESKFLDFVHEALGFLKIEPGDKAISFLKTAVATAVVGDKIGNYKIMAVADNSTFWTIHGRI